MGRMEGKAAVVTGGARGIGESTTRSVVLSFMLILILDYLLTRLMM
jgi:phospholipid/cholesterol/gamma-HCH transport system permease protein